MLEAAEETTDPGLLVLRAKLERACGCTIDELAKIAKTWDTWALTPDSSLSYRHRR